MTPRFNSLFALCLAGATLSGGVATAQSTTNDLTESQIIERLTAQQKTRGIGIAPSGTTATTTSQVQTTAVQTATGTTVTYAEIAQDDQINIPISFDFDSAALRPDQKPKLATMCGAMKAVQVEKFLILGHTDATGSDAYNERLSLLRAEEVKRHLVTECGIEPVRLEAVGMGSRALYDKKNPKADENRRVEFQVLS